MERYDFMKIAMTDSVLRAMFVILYQHFAIQVLPRLGRGGWCLPLQWDLLTSQPRDHIDLLGGML